MAKSLDKVLQPDGTYKWELVEPTHDQMMGNDPVTACPTPIVKPKLEDVTTKKPAVEKTNDFDSMTKKQLEDFGRTIGIELDKRHTKKVLIKELKEKLNQSS
jgi:hypothetical protein|tara:strand:+ start:68 stop:373 length:306 start_codon:yes stop_codon:yes gene_type:complete